MQYSQKWLDNSIKNGQRTWIDIFFQKSNANDKQIYEKLLKIIVSYHSIHLSRWLLLNSQKITIISEDVEQSEHLHIVGENVNFYIHM